MSSIVLSDTKQELQTALRSFASALANLTDDQIPAALELARDLGKLAEETESQLKTRCLLYLNVNGHQVTDKGSTQANVGGYRVTAIPTRTGLDPKKLEVVLRRKGLQPADAMDATVTYKVNQQKVDKLVADGGLTNADITSALYDKSFRLSVERE